MTAPARFYRDVSIQQDVLGFGDYRILLDGKAVRTPAGAWLTAPHALAEAIAEEWRAQGQEIRLDTMLLTRLANSAIDQVRTNRQMVCQQVHAFGRSDLICYRAQGPQSLVARQAAEWDGLLDWARASHGIALHTGVGIGFIEQPPSAMAALEKTIAAYDDFGLAGLHAAAILLGSAIIALALSEGHVSVNRALAAAELDALHQAERWGHDSEAQIRLNKNASELAELERFFQISR